jgi:hypothetical protein
MIVKKKSRRSTAAIPMLDGCRREAGSSTIAAISPVPEK